MTQAEYKSRKLTHAEEAAEFHEHRADDGINPEYHRKRAEEHREQAAQLKEKAIKNCRRN